MWACRTGSVRIAAFPFCLSRARFDCFLAFCGRLGACCDLRAPGLLSIDSVAARAKAFSRFRCPAARDARQCAEANAQRGHSSPKIVERRSHNCINERTYFQNRFADRLLSATGQTSAHRPTPNERLSIFNGHIRSMQNVRQSSRAISFNQIINSERQKKGNHFFFVFAFKSFALRFGGHCRCAIAKRSRSRCFRCDDILVLAV